MMTRTTGRLTSARTTRGLVVVTLALGALAACRSGERAHQEAVAITGGDPDRGRQAIRLYGCGTCHEIAGVAGAEGKVGPPLTGIASRAYIAGVLPNTPENLARWIKAPQSIVPGNAMPDMGVSASDAADITAYLYKLR